MIEEQNPNNEQQHEENVNLYAIFFKYLAYWPWFVASVIVCLILAFVYLRYQAPVYNVTSAVLIKEDDSSKRGMGAASGALEAMQNLGGLSMSNNFDNEVEILKSRTLIRKVITSWGFTPPWQRTVCWATTSRCTRPLLSTYSCRPKRRKSWRQARGSN